MNTVKSQTSGILVDLPPPPKGKVGWPWTVESPVYTTDNSASSFTPKFSIVTPSYNQGEYIEATIRSVLLQNYPAIEYVIIDGGSSDNSVEIIKRYEPWLSFWSSEPDCGQSSAINKGFSHCSGEIFAWLNSDDQYAASALSLVEHSLPTSTDVGAVYGRGVKVRPDGVSVYEPALPVVNLDTLFNWCFGNNFMQPSCFFTQAAWDCAGPLDEDNHHAMDLDLWIRIARQGLSFIPIDELLSRATEHPGAKTKSERGLMFADTCISYVKNGNSDAARKLIDHIYRQNTCRHEVTDILVNIPGLIRVIRTMKTITSKLMRG